MPTTPPTTVTIRNRWTDEPIYTIEIPGDTPSGNLAEIKALRLETWPVKYTATHMQIGCQLHTL